MKNTPQFLRGQEETNAQHWMEEAAKVAAQSLCLRARCGAVIVNGDDSIGQGYNAPPLDNLAHRRCLVEYDAAPKPKYDRTCCVHAEWRAIMDGLRRHPTKMSGAVLYFTRVDPDGKILRSGQPFCTVCSRLALDADLAQFVLWHDDGIKAYPTDIYNELSYQQNL